MILELVGVVTDGATPAAGIEPKSPFRQDIVVPRGEPLTIKLTVLKQDHTAKNIATDTIRLGVREFREDASAKITKQGALVDAPTGRSNITVPAGGTDSLVEFAFYWFDIQLTESGGTRWQVVPLSSFRIAPVVNRASDPVV